MPDDKIKSIAILLGFTIFLIGFISHINHDGRVGIYNEMTSDTIWVFKGDSDKILKASGIPDNILQMKNGGF